MDCQARRTFSWCVGVLVGDTRTPYFSVSLNCSLICGVFCALDIRNLYGCKSEQLGEALWQTVAAKESMLRVSLVRKDNRRTKWERVVCQANVDIRFLRDTKCHRTAAVKDRRQAVREINERQDTDRNLGPHLMGRQQGPSSSRPPMAVTIKLSLGENQDDHKPERQASGHQKC
ncbi:uncharacterized protein LOC142780923 [Rhipicephalus microplus]|uniref:uncharacterized protein LOC142780923 n=1 Tax=Rhipicephalus microplus TaxID=6941 RepID=UPI003F6C2BD1